MKALRAKLDASLDETMYVSQIDGFIKRMEDISGRCCGSGFYITRCRR